jgi:hypothetical protein
MAETDAAVHPDDRDVVSGGARRRTGIPGARLDFDKFHSIAQARLPL